MISHVLSNVRSLEPSKHPVFSFIQPILPNIFRAAAYVHFFLYFNLLIHLLFISICTSVISIFFAFDPSEIDFFTYVELQILFKIKIKIKI